MKYLTQIVLAVAVVASLAGGVFLLVRGPSGSGEIEIILPTPTVELQADLKVYISGGVNTPGLYEFREGDRLADVVEVAGGATGAADLAAVNLAVRVKDEQHWHIPIIGEPPRAVPIEGVETGEKIDLNSAPVEVLKTLPGIGDVKAVAIVAYREDNGPFFDIEAIVEVQGIGQATLAAIRELVEVR